MADLDASYEGWLNDSAAPQRAQLLAALASLLSEFPNEASSRPAATVPATRQAPATLPQEESSQASTCTSSRTDTQQVPPTGPSLQPEGERTPTEQIVQVPWATQCNSDSKHKALANRILGLAPGQGSHLTAVTSTPQPTTTTLTATPSTATCTPTSWSAPSQAPRSTGASSNAIRVIRVSVPNPCPPAPPSAPSPSAASSQPTPAEASGCKPAPRRIAPQPSSSGKPSAWGRPPSAAPPQAILHATPGSSASTPKLPAWGAPTPSSSCSVSKPPTVPQAASTMSAAPGTDHHSAQQAWRHPHQGAPATSVWCTPHILRCNADGVLVTPSTADTHSSVPPHPAPGPGVGHTAGVHSSSNRPPPPHATPPIQAHPQPQPAADAVAAAGTCAPSDTLTTPQRLRIPKQQAAEQATWSAAHTRLAGLHAALLMHGHYHDGLVYDTMQLVTVLITLSAHSPPAPPTTAPSCPRLSAAVARAQAHAGEGPGTGEGSVWPSSVQQELEQLLPLLRPQQWSRGTMQTYLCKVVDSCAHLVCSLGQRVWGLLQDAPRVMHLCPRLADHLDQLQHTHQHADPAKPVLTLPMKSSLSSQSLASGAKVGEESRRQSNREKARDAWHTLAKEANALTTALCDPSAQATLIQELQRMASGRPAASERSSPAAAQLQGLLSLQKRVEEFLTALHPDNMAFVAELAATSVMQAAVTGQAVIEGAVASLAQQDPSRFARLSARMLPESDTPSRLLGSSRGQPGMQSGSRGRRPQSSRPPDTPSTAPRRDTSSTGFEISLATRDSRLSGPVAPNSNMSFQHGVSTTPAVSHPSHALGKEFVFAAGARLTRSILLLDEFDSVQRAFVLLLELSDSRALINAVGRAMAAQLTAAIAALPGWSQLLEPAGNTTTPPLESANSYVSLEPGSSGAICTGGFHDTPGMNNDGVGQRAHWGKLSAQQQRVLRERMTAIVTLSNYLSYLTHAHQAASKGDSVQPSSMGSCGHLLGSHLNDSQCRQPAVVVWPGATASAVQLLRVALAAGMPLVLPCVAHLLWHVGLDPDVVQPSLYRPAAPTLDSTPQAALQLLWQLRQHRELQPVCDSWGPCAAAVRTLTDEVFMRVAGAAGCKPHELGQLLGFSASSPLPLLPADGSLHTLQPQLQGSAGCTDGLTQGRDLTSQFALVAATPTASSQPQLTSTGALAATATHQQQEPPQPDLQLDAWDCVVDPWLLELCCPMLDSSCRRLQRLVASQQAAGSQLTSVAGTPSRGPAPGPMHTLPDTPPPSAGGIQGSAGAFDRSALPSPLGSTPPLSAVVPRKVHAVRVSAARRTRPALALVPANVYTPPSWMRLLQSASGAATSLMAAGSSTEDVSLQLQQAFLAQYSGEEQPVKLRDVSSMVAEFVAANACAGCMAQAVQPSLPEAEQQLAAAAAVCAERAQVLGSDSRAAAGPNKSQTGLGGVGISSGQPAAGADAGQLQPPAPTELFSASELDACLDHVHTALEDIALRTVRSVLKASEQLCQAHTTHAVDLALRALLPATWPQAVHAAARAVTSRVALTTCAQRLVQQVPGMVVRHLQQQAEAVCKSALKASKLQALEVEAQDPCPRDTSAASTSMPTPGTQQCQAHDTAPGTQQCQADATAPVCPDSSGVTLGAEVECWVGAPSDSLGTQDKHTSSVWPDSKLDDAAEASTSQFGQVGVGVVEQLAQQVLQWAESEVPDSCDTDAVWQQRLLAVCSLAGAGGALQQGEEVTCQPQPQLRGSQLACLGQQLSHLLICQPLSAQGERLTVCIVQVLLQLLTAASNAVAQPQSAERPSAAATAMHAAAPGVADSSSSGSSGPGQQLPALQQPAPGTDSPDSARLGTKKVCAGGSLSAVPNTPAIHQATTGQVLGPGGVVVLLSHTLVQLFRALMVQCHNSTHTCTAPELRSARPQRHPTDTAPPSKAQVVAGREAPAAVVAGLLEVLLQVPPAVTAVGVSLNSLEVVQAMRAALQTATLPGLACVLPHGVPHGATQRLCPG